MSTYRTRLCYRYPLSLSYCREAIEKGTCTKKMLEHLLKIRQILPVKSASGTQMSTLFPGTVMNMRLRTNADCKTSVLFCLSSPYVLLILQ